MGRSGREWSVRSIDGVTVPHLAAAAAVLVAVLVRSSVVREVLRPTGIALLGNDPYRIRYYVERFAARASSPADLSAFALPDTNPYPLQIATLGWFTELLGGTAEAAGLVLAAYPVVVTAVAVAIAYAVGTRLTGSRWVGVLAAVALAIVPGHVAYTAFGFGDHHAFDYLWLAVTVYAVLLLTDHEPDGVDGRTLLLTLAVGVSVAAQILAWVAGVLLVVPLGVYVVVATVDAVRSRRSPLRRVGPLVAATGLAAGLVAAAHVAFGWHPPAIPVVAALLSLGSAVVLLGGTVAARASSRYAPVAFLASVCLGTAVGVSLVLQSVPDARAFVDQGVTYFQRTSGSGIAETASLFGGADGPVFGPLATLGLLLFLAAPALLFLTARLVREPNPRWALLATYGWYFLGLSAVQRRFVGELSLFVALFAAVAFVEVARRGGVVAERHPFPPSPAPCELELNTSVSIPVVYVLSAVGLLVVAASFASVPVLTTQLTVDDDQYAAATWMDEYAEQRGIPESEQYVFSPWDRNLMYNYVVNGESDSYAYAQRNYLRFAVATDGEAWYDKLRSRNTGFVVTHGAPTAGTNPRLHGALHGRLGSGTTDARGLSHYRAVYRSGDGTVTVFRPARGSLVSGTAAPNETVTVRTDVSIPGAAFTYRRSVEATANGRYGVFVPYPGTYHADAGGEPVVVSERNVRRGTYPHEPGSSAHWPLDEGRGVVLFDTAGGHHASVRGATWTNGVHDRALSFDGDDRAVVPDRVVPEVDGAFTLSLWFRTRAGSDYREEYLFPRLASKAPSSYVGNTSGYQLSLSHGSVLGGVGDGPGAARIVGPSVDDGRWHHAALTWNGSVARLYVDGQLEGQGRFSGDPTNDYPLVFGASADLRNHFVGRLDEVRLLDRAQTPAEIRAQYNRTAGTRPTDAPA